MSAVHNTIRRARRELLLVLLLALLAYAAAAAIELSERLERWFELAERWQVDELPFALMVLACGLAWYAFRRRAEAERALHLHAAAEARASALLARNRELSQGLIALQESERRALARELHDEIGQCCTALRLETAFMRRAGDRAAVLAAAERADATAQSIDRLVRGLLHRLRPAQLDLLGLVPALQELCESWELRSGVGCVFHHEGADGECDCDEPTAIAIYRVAQEALTNVMRHAQASAVRVVLARSANGELRLTVRDDGVGLDPARPRGGLGLLGAEERAAALGGRLALVSAPGAGVRLELSLPPVAANEARAAA